MRGRRVMLMGLLLLAAAAPALGNGPEVGRDAGVVFPIHSEGVRLMHESVAIQLSGSEVDRTRAECSYTLFNETDVEKTIEMSFVYTEPELWNSRGFKVIAQRPTRRIPVHFEPIDPELFGKFIAAVPDSLPVWKLTIPPRESVDVTIVYDVAWTMAAGHYFFRYHALPAALWDGDVKSARIRVEFLGLFGALVRCAGMDGCLSWKIEPAGFQWKGSAIEWNLTDWEPTEDFTIVVDVPGLDHADE